MKMGALARMLGLGRGRMTPAVSDPAPLELLPRPTSGLWAMLTDEQRANLAAYRGPETHG